MHSQTLKSKLLPVGLAVALIVSTLGACGTPVPATPTTGPIVEPTAQPSATPAEEEGPLPDAVHARDLVLAYLLSILGDKAPPAGLDWSARRTTPEGLVGSESWEFRAETWFVTLSYPVVAPENAAFSISISNPATGFDWAGQVDAGGNITEIAEDAEPLLVLDAVTARDLVLAYMVQNVEGAALPEGLDWAERRTTPEGLVGAESYEYTAGDWTVSLDYAVTSPQDLLFGVVVRNRATGFAWEAVVDSAGDVIEFGSPDEEPTPSAPTAGAEDPGRLVEGNTEFALDLYQLLRDSGEGNLFFSPYSISLALAMTYAGARGETEQQMAETLGFDLPQAELHAAFRALAQELASRGKGAQGKDAKGFRLNVANALWGQEGYRFVEPFLDLLAENYGAGMERVNFARTEPARAQINEWVSDRTGGRIEDLIPPGVLNELTRLVLTNAVYFNAAWATPFQEKVTLEGDFYRLDGSRVRVPMMRQSASLAYGEGPGYQVVELPYDGYELSMVVFLPTQQRLASFEGKLTSAELRAMLEALSPRQVSLSLPRFEYESSLGLKDTLSQLGMPLAFTTDADLTGMSADPELFLSDVLHKAFVSVDEAGTEAAAATAVVVGTTSMPSEPVEFKADRPFLFLIRDRKTGTVLFLGRVLDPAK